MNKDAELRANKMSQKQRRPDLVEGRLLSRALSSVSVWNSDLSLHGAASSSHSGGLPSRLWDFRRCLWRDRASQVTQC